MALPFALDVVHVAAPWPKVAGTDPDLGSSHGALVAGDFWKRREIDRLKGVFLDSANLRPVDRLNRLGNLAPAAIRRRLAGRNSSV